MLVTFAHQPRKKMGPSMDSDEEDDDEDDSKLNEAGREIKKALLKLEKNKVYADDDDRDPYASVSLFYYDCKFVCFSVEDIAD